MGIHSYFGIGTIIISTIGVMVMLYYIKEIVEFSKDIAESRNSIAESRNSIAESQRETINILSSHIKYTKKLTESRKKLAVLKANNATLTKMLKRILRSITVADADNFSEEEIRWYVDNCSAYNVHCLLSDVDSSLPTSA